MCDLFTTTSIFRVRRHEFESENDGDNAVIRVQLMPVDRPISFTLEFSRSRRMYRKSKLGINWTPVRSICLHRC